MVKMQNPNTNVQMQGPDGKPMPFMVQAKDCVDESHLHKNISTNLKLVHRRVEICRPNKGRVLVASGGPSTKKYMDLVKKEQEAGTLIVCVKHSLPTLLDGGVIPDACVILDPRDVEGISTHNIKRTELFNKVPKETVFLVASMTNPSVTKLLLDSGANVVLWDAEVANIKEYFKHDVKWSVVGGSCSAVRAVTLFKAMGYSDFSLLGFDCSFEEIPSDIGAKLPDGRPKYMQVEILGKKYTTTGELVALVQDLERLMGFQLLDFNVEVVGDGIPADIYRKTYKPRPTYSEMIKAKLEQPNTPQ
jgi:hypothetical protein